MNSATQLRWRIAFCLWLVIVTIATHAPAMKETENPIFVSPDKLFHYVSFGVLALSFWCAGWTKNKWLAVCLLLCWVVIDEVTQAALPLDRPFSWGDLISSLLGVIAAVSWMGALSIPKFATIQRKVDLLLSRNVAWLILCPIAIVGTIGIGTAVWFAFWKMFDISNSSASLCLGLLITTALLLVIIVYWAQISAKQLVTKLIIKLLIVGLVSVIIGFSTRGLEVGSWTVGLAFFSIAFSRIWRGVVIDNSYQGTM
ncbi:hypothetical protein H8D29_07030 [PVC group bacterium]|nr:hypothetical protein [PVC group bacterium]